MAESPSFDYIPKNTCFDRFHPAENLPRRRLSQPLKEEDEKLLTTLEYMKTYYAFQVIVWDVYGTVLNKSIARLSPQEKKQYCTTIVGSQLVSQDFLRLVRGLQAYGVPTLHILVGFKPADRWLMEALVDSLLDVNQSSPLADDAVDMQQQQQALTRVEYWPDHEGFFVETSRWTDLFSPAFLRDLHRVLVISARQEELQKAVLASDYRSRYHHVTGTELRMKEGTKYNVMVITEFRVPQLYETLVFYA